LVTLLVLAPLAVRFDPFPWSTWGPYWFPSSRALHSLLYLVLGMAIGVYGLERGFLARDGKLRRRWWLWCVASLAAFAAGTGVGTAAMTVHLGSRAGELAGDSTFVLSSAASSFAFLALLVRFSGKRRRIFERLNENAYGIYLVHYAFVSWAQLALLKLELPAMAKAPVVLVSAGLLSWGTVALLGRIPLGQLARRGA
jgi:surface polysaccharide O-acyltransferase-like enzyme